MHGNDSLPVYSTFVHENFKCMGIMQDDLCHPYILSTTVLSDKYVATYVHMLFIRIYLSPTMYVHVCVQVLDHITAGMEDILGHVGHNKIRVRSFNLYDVASFFLFHANSHCAQILLIPYL